MQATDPVNLTFLSACQPSPVSAAREVAVAPYTLLAALSATVAMKLSKRYLFKPFCV